MLVKARKNHGYIVWFGYYRTDSRHKFTRVEGLLGPIGYTSKQAALDAAAHTVRLASKQENDNA